MVFQIAARTAPELRLRKRTHTTLVCLLATAIGIAFAAHASSLSVLDFADPNEVQNATAHRPDFALPEAPPGLASQRPTPSQLVRLGAYDDTLSTYIAAKWRVSASHARHLVLVARRAADAHSVDPLLLLAIIARESSFQNIGNAGDIGPVPNSVDPSIAHGLMQVAGRFHPEKMPVDASGNMRVTTDEENIWIGAAIVEEYVTGCDGDLQLALQRYGGNSADETHRYARAILQYQDQFYRLLARSI